MNMKYYIIFKMNGSKVCGVHKEAATMEEAIEKAEYSFLCHLWPQYKYDDIECFECKGP